MSKKLTKALKAQERYLESERLVGQLSTIAGTLFEKLDYKEKQLYTVATEKLVSTQQQREYIIENASISVPEPIIAYEERCNVNSMGGYRDILRAWRKRQTRGF